MNKLWFRFVLCLYALLYAICLPLILGIENSYSDFHTLEPVLFPIATILVSLGLWLHKGIKWKIPAFLLIIVACFNVVDWPQIHNIAAVLFFISSTWIMHRDKRFKLFGILSILMYPLLWLNVEKSLFIFEAIQIPLLAAYHLARVVYLLKLKKKV